MTVRDGFPIAERPGRFDDGVLKLEKPEAFPALSLERAEIAGYLRTGGCTAGCGACCESFVIPIVPDARAAEDFEDVVNGELILPVDPIVQTRAGTEGFEDWEHWLNLHGTYLVLLASGTLTAVLPSTTTPPGELDFDAWVLWLETHQITVLRQREGGRLRAHMPTPCRELDDYGKCGIFGMAGRPKMCSNYPHHPADIEGLGGFCTYKFQALSAANLVARPAPSPPRKKKRKKKKRKKR